MRLASKRSEPVTVMAIVPVSPKPFFLRLLIFLTYAFHQRKECIEIIAFTLLPGLDVVSAVSGALVVFRVSADSSVEVPASEKCIASRTWLPSLAFTCIIHLIREKNA